MAINLKNITMYMFRTIYEREDTYNKFKPYFYRFIGVEDSSNYDNYIKTIQNKCLEEDKCIIRAISIWRRCYIQENSPRVKRIRVILKPLWI